MYLLFMYLFMKLVAYLLKSYHQNSNAIVLFVCWGHGYFMNATWGVDSNGAYNYTMALLFW